MVTIYAIEDINDLIYVGSTKQKLHQRLTEHRYNKRHNRQGSSKKLNLEYCIIYELEKCEEKNRMEREAYWIEKLQSVNANKLNFNHLEYRKEVYEKTKDSLLYYHKNKKTINERRKKMYDKSK